MKIWTVILLSLFAQSIVCAQTRVVAECTVNYSIQIKGDEKMDNETAALLKSSSKIVYIKGNDSRVDLLSTTFLQTLIYDKSTGGAVIMRELGANKFMTKLDNKAWANQNSKYTGMVITYLDEVKQILGYECKKAILQLNDGNTFSVYYATAISPSVREFEFQFKDIPGFVLEYETLEGKGEKITFTATKINLNPVPASKFDIPTSGYRLLN
jgi:GLPGLI family protein